MRPPMSAPRPAELPRIEPSALVERCVLNSATGRRDPCELPAYVEAVADRRVQPGPAARRDAMGGVADQEGVALSEPLRERDPEGDRHRTLDLDRQNRVAGPVPDPPRHPLMGERVEVADRDLEGEDPPIRFAGGQEGASVRHEVDPVAVLADEIPDMR
jgi:hypothetical protein